MSKRRKYTVDQYKDDVFLKRWNSVTEASKTLGIHEANIAQNARGRASRPHAGGYQWKYVEEDIDPEEEWREHPVFKKMVSNKGRVKINPCWPTKGFPITKGYLQVSFRQKSRRVCILVHRLVADVFLQAEMTLAVERTGEKVLQINHKDGDKTNNNVSNLEWVSGKENVQHYLRELKTYPL